MVVWGIWTGDTFYFSTGHKSRKMRNLKANPQCVICTEQANEAVIMQGVCRKIERGPILRQFADAYYKKYKWKIDVAEPVLAVSPKIVFALWEKDFTGSATRWIFARR